MSEISKKATEYCKNTVIIDETESRDVYTDDPYIYNCRAMAFAAGAHEALTLFLAECEKEITHEIACIYSTTESMTPMAVRATLLFLFKKFEKIADELRKK